MQQPLVSVVITSYNYGKYIRSALESVKRQTYRPIECIVVDDVSTDDSVEVVRKFIQENPATDEISFRLVQQGKNSGQLAAFERGIQESKGVFLNFLDADDMLFAEFINTHVQVLLNKNVGMSVSEQIIVDENSVVVSLTEDGSSEFNHFYPVKSICEYDVFSRKIQSMTIPNDETPLTIKVNELDLFGFWFWRPTSNCFFRKSVLDLFDFSGEYEKWRICADRLILNFVHYTAGSCHISRRLAAYRIHGMNSYNKKRIFGSSPYRPSSQIKMNGTKEKTAYSIFSIFLKKMKRNDAAYSDPAFFRSPVMKILPALSPLFILRCFPLWSKLLGGVSAILILPCLPFLGIWIRLKKLMIVLSGKPK